MTAVSKKRIAVAVSGGVDSLCALCILRDAGHELLALHGLFLPREKDADPAPALGEACARLGVPFHVLDLRETFRREVITPFVHAWRMGQTPNPCAICNRAVKFGALLDHALALGCDTLATGHYAALAAAGTGRRAPAHAADHDKDQSYFLSLVPGERLARALFPLAEHSKSTSRALVASAGLPVPLPRESQDICFVGRGYGSCRDFLCRQWQNMGITPPPEGPVLLRDANAGLREIGRHQGLWRHTEGQRRGLGIPHGEGLYVLAKDVERNALIVGPAAALAMRGCITGPANIFLPRHHWPGNVLARVRYRQKAAPAKAEIRRGRLIIIFDRQQHPTAPGQLAAVSDGEGRILAAGIVERFF